MEDEERFSKQVLEAKVKELNELCKKTNHKIAIKHGKVFIYSDK